MKDSPQVTLIQNEEVVQALFPDAPKEPFDDGIHPRCPVGDAHLLDAARPRHPGERRAEFRVIVTDEGPPTSLPPKRAYCNLRQIGQS